MQQLRQRLYNGSNEVYKELVSTLEKPDITENGALQLLFDHMFLNTIFHDVQKSVDDSEIVEKLQDQVHTFCDGFTSYDRQELTSPSFFYSCNRLILSIGQVMNPI